MGTGLTFHLFARVLLRISFTCQSANSILTVFKGAERREVPKKHASSMILDSHLFIENALFCKKALRLREGQSFSAEGSGVFDGDVASHGIPNHVTHGLILLPTNLPKIDPQCVMYSFGTRSSHSGPDVAEWGGVS